jgi:N-hydroxyarylamine O-acetyltransferase
VNLDTYFRRIGYTGPRTPTLDTLGAVLDRHVVAIPFENIDVMLGITPKLDLAALEDKLVARRRGGYCYEHATLFAAVLAELGFDVATHSARVTMFVPKDRAPRTHMFLTVTLPAGRFVVDPGFGGLTPRVPVPLDGTPAGDHAIARDGDDYVLAVRTPDKVAHAWTSTLHRDYPIDFEMANLFTATSPLSPFTRGLRMRAFAGDAKVTVAARTVTLPGGEQRQLAHAAELRPIVREYFGFDEPALDALELPAAP